MMQILLALATNTLFPDGENRHWLDGHRVQFPMLVRCPGDQLGRRSAHIVWTPTGWGHMQHCGRGGVCTADLPFWQLGYRHRVFFDIFYSWTWRPVGMFRKCNGPKFREYRWLWSFTLSIHQRYNHALGTTNQWTMWWRANFTQWYHRFPESS